MIKAAKRITIDKALVEEIKKIKKNQGIKNLAMTRDVSRRNLLKI